MQKDEQPSGGENRRSDYPRFPVLPEPSSVRRTMLWEFWDHEIDGASSLEHLLSLMFEWPQAKFFIFRVKENGSSGVVGSSEARGALQTVETQRHWYRHPNFKRDFVRVVNGGNWEWEKQLVKEGEELLRSEIQLTPKERLHREQLKLIDTMNSVSNQPKNLSLYEKFNEHYNRHPMAYYLFAAMLGILGLATAL